MYICMGTGVLSCDQGPISQEVCGFLTQIPSGTSSHYLAHATISCATVPLLPCASPTKPHWSYSLKFCSTPHWSYDPLVLPFTVRRPIVPTDWSPGDAWPIGPRNHWSYDPIFRRFIDHINQSQDVTQLIGPTIHWAYTPGYYGWKLSPENYISTLHTNEWKAT